MVAVRVKETETVSPYNNFEIGDIVEIDMGRTGGWTMAEVETSWERFWNRPLRDNDDIKAAKELVLSNGSNLGWAVGKLNSDPVRCSKFRTVTP